jgi:hypothetical protein
MYFDEHYAKDPYKPSKKSAAKQGNPDSKVTENQTTILAAIMPTTNNKSMLDPKQ